MPHRTSHTRGGRRRDVGVKARRTSVTLATANHRREEAHLTRRTGRASMLRSLKTRYTGRARAAGGDRVEARLTSVTLAAANRRREEARRAA